MVNLKLVKIETHCIKLQTKLCQIFFADPYRPDVCWQQILYFGNFSCDKYTVHAYNNLTACQQDVFALLVPSC
jgi:hypothetical protein